MSWWTRISNALGGTRLDREIDEEMESHLREAAEHGRDPAEARRAFGSPLRQREASRDAKVAAWLDSVRADTVFALRQFRKKKLASAAAVLSLGLAIGACTTAFRLIDGLIFRPLPIAQPDRLYAVARSGVDDRGRARTINNWAYPAFVLMRAAVKGDTELVAASSSNLTDLTYPAGSDTERAYVQYVSGWMFGQFGLQPAAGRVFSERDDERPGAHPYAVISHDYWRRRFGGNPNVVGRTFRLSETVYEIVGVAAAPFTGTERGTITDIFLPMMMHKAVTHSDWTWFRTLAMVRRGAAIEPMRAKLHATSRAFEEERAKGFTGMSKESIARFLDVRVVVAPAPAGYSDLQQEYRQALLALGVVVLLVLLIACANVANLMTAQAAARAREMALRVSIGAGKWRIVQLVLMESACLALIASAIGAAFAAWSAPYVISQINPPDDPARLDLPLDWRVLAFSLALTLCVTVLLGLVPALRASSVRPAAALKGGEDPRARHRLMHGLIAAQVAFCFVVLFVAGLFAATFDRLAHRPMGFVPERLLALEAVTVGAQPPVYWEQVAQHLRTVPGVERVSLAGWPLLAGRSWNGFVSINGAPPGPAMAYFLNVAPGWVETMRLELVAGQDLQPGDTSPGAALVNQAFVKQFCAGINPLGVEFNKQDAPYRIVGVVRDAPYEDIRDTVPPVVYVPLQTRNKSGLQPVGRATFMVRTAGANPLALAATLRREVRRARSEFRASNIRSQLEIVEAQTVRERLLAVLAVFFAGVALLLAAIGLYGVLDYGVQQRRREIGIRMAIGAQAGDIARRITAQVFAMVALGAVMGIAGGMAAVSYVESLLYQVRGNDPWMLGLPGLTIVCAALLAAVPAVRRAVRIDPAETLRAD